MSSREVVLQGRIALVDTLKSLMSQRLRARLVLAIAALSPAAVQCTEHSSPTGAPPTAPPPSAARAPDASAATASTSTGDAGASTGDGGPLAYAGPYIGAIVLQAPVMSEMEWPGNRRAEKDRVDREPKVTRIGTLRYGEKTPVVAEAHKKPNCPEGWYELVAGGFVCGKYASLDLDHPKIKEVKPPDLDGAVPYTYGINLANGTPLYRHVPSREERTKLEPWLSRPRKAKTDDGNPYASPSIPDAAPDAQGIGEGAGDSKPDWWDREVPDGGPPDVTLEDLQMQEGPIERRMVKGFFLSLDHQFPASGSVWWKTVAGKVAPSDRIIVAKPATEFHGVWLGQDTGSFATKNVASRKVDKLPMAFVTWYFAKRYTLDDKHKHATVAPGPLDRFDAVGLTGQTAVAEGYEYWETDESWWIRASSATKTEPGPAPRDLGEHEKWIDVNLKRQTLVAFEGQTPVFVTLVSSGRNEHETTPGSFHIREKHITSTMDADTAADGPYSIEDVPYIEYFNAGYALHSAFWHSEFGHVKSHGCVNLAPWDAKALFGWTDPQLPEGWHAIFASKDHPGTRVIVHERADGTCTGPEAAPPQCP
jgi:lipoprotein-anchoring transpeptidase ErfK/SrfK